VLLGRGAFRSLLATTALVVLGQFAAYTYIVPYMERVLEIPTALTAPLLLLFGLVGAVGNLAAGVIANRNPVRASLAMTTTIAVALAGLALVGGQRLPATVFLVVWGFGAGGLAVGLQTRVLALAPDAPDLASALFAGAFNIGIGGGALLGGGIVDRLGLARDVAVAAGLAVLAVVVQAVSAARRPAGGVRASGEESA
jgi:predicted MFS family arabinose efflux permease